MDGKIFSIQTELDSELVSLSWLEQLLGLSEFQSSSSQIASPEKEEEVRPNSNVWLLKRKSLIAEGDRSLTNGSNSRSKSNHHCHRMRSIGKYEDFLEVNCFSQKQTRSREEVGGGEQVEGDKGKRLWVRKSKPKRLPNFYGNAKLSIGEKKERDPTCLGRARPALQNLTAAKRKFINFHVRKTQSDDIEEQAHNVENGHHISTSSEPLLDIVYDKEGTAGVKTPVKTTKQRRATKKGVATKCHKMRTRNSKDTYQVSVQEERIEVEVGGLMRWNLGEEMAKVIEKGVALGVNFKSRDAEMSEGDMDNGQWNLEDEVAKVIEKNGGLDIGRMVDKNRSLLAKWIWRFGIEEKALWRRVMCARYGISSTSLGWIWKSSQEASVFVKAIASLFEGNNMVSKAVCEGFKVVVGNGRRAEFWELPGGDMLQLKLACPRIFALAIKKSGVVQDFEHW
ncbi:hypothetical protein LWI29_012039 [Acer saccharum]|uniref:Uncharacterized protein n=1 Tax=Acer saccharum TaxID=4024 RepID=A0AA39SZA7_ACESA|nr:hypothetical protein LWI29_012039 [Acer saccharum]